MKIITLFIALLLFNACTPKNGQDPLKNSKKLIIKGHTSIYENGILEIPYTKINLIPSLSQSTDLSHQLLFQDARAALQQGIKDALDSVYVIPKGTKRAYEISKDIYRFSDDISDDIRKYTRANATLLIKKSSTFAKEHIRDSFKSGYQTGKETYALGSEIENYFDVASSDILDSHWSRSKKTLNRSIDIAKKVDSVSSKWANEDFKFGVSAFITGYLALPKKLDKNLNKMGESLRASSFKNAYESAEATRKKSSLFFTDIISDTFSDYTE